MLWIAVSRVQGVPEKALCYVKLAAGKIGFVCFADYAATVNMAT